MTHAEQVPVKMAGKTVGMACINADGTIDLTMDGPSELGQELLDRIVKGLCSGISIAPVSVPAEPAAYTSLGGSCFVGSCVHTYADHEWGKKRAHRDGWFFARDGRAWCPDHVPAWATTWRAPRR